MKPQEIRIGNWVMGNKPYHWGLDDFADWYYDHNSHTYGDSVKPIPLTEEWLLKFGLEENDYTYIKGVHQKVFSGLMKFEFNETLKNWEFSVGYITDITRILYVHELQNLYWCLCGEELYIY